MSRFLARSNQGNCIRNAAGIGLSTCVAFEPRSSGDTMTLEQTINEVTQGLRSMEEAVSWFSSLEQVEQKEVLHEVVRYSIQAHVTDEDGRVGLSQSGVKPTMTPAVLIVREPILEQMGEMIDLPSNEYVKSFRVLLSTFAVADTRRRETECRGACSHDWHNL
jgi:hypothetical protein